MKKRTVPANLLNCNSLGGAPETQNSNQEENDPVLVMMRMNTTINIVKKGTFRDMLSVVRKVAKYILEPFSETDNRQLRQSYGDHLSDIGAPHQLTVLLRRLMDIGMEIREAWLGMCVVRRVFWNYSEASLKMAMDLGQSGLLKIMLDDLDTCGAGISKNEVKSKLRSNISCYDPRSVKAI